MFASSVQALSLTGVMGLEEAQAFKTIMRGKRSERRWKNSMTVVLGENAVDLAEMRPLKMQ